MLFLVLSVWQRFRPVHLKPDQGYNVVQMWNCFCVKFQTFVLATCEMPSLNRAACCQLQIRRILILSRFMPSISLKMIFLCHPAIGREKVPSPYNRLLGLLSFSQKSQHINLLNGDGTFGHHGLPVFYTSCALKCALVCCRYKSVCWRTRRYSWAALSLKTEKIGDWSLKTEWVTLFPGRWQSKRKKNRETADVTWFVRKWEFSGSENQEPKSLLKILVWT